MRLASLTRQVDRQLACVQSRPGAAHNVTAAQRMLWLLVTCFATAICGRLLLQAVVDYRRALDAEK